MFGIGTTELILILIVIMIIFGVGKLPQVGEGLGKAMKSFKKAAEDEDGDLEVEKDKKRAE